MKIHIGNYQPGDQELFKKIAKEFGFHFTDTLEECDVRLCVDPVSVDDLIPARDLVILLEPEVVRPDLYRPSILDNFRLLMPLGRYRAERLGLRYFFSSPVELPNYKRDRELIRQKRIAIVNEHKFSSSRRSTYGLRRKVILSLQEQRRQDFDLFGKDWNANRVLELRRRIYALRNFRKVSDISIRETFSDLWRRYPAQIGLAPGNGSILQNYSQSIIIENDLDYVSEKIWKSVYAGCAITYVGPKLKYDPSIQKILFCAEPIVEDIVNLTFSLDSIEINEKTELGLDFLHSREFEPYQAQHCYFDFWRQLSELLNAQSN